MTTDRVAEIRRGDGFGPSEDTEDILWLCDEVERLRELLSEAYEFVADNSDGYNPLAERIGRFLDATKNPPTNPVG